MLYWFQIRDTNKRITVTEDADSAQRKGKWWCIIYTNFHCFPWTRYIWVVQQKQKEVKDDQCFETIQNIFFFKWSLQSAITNNAYTRDYSKYPVQKNTHTPLKKIINKKNQQASCYLPRKIFHFLRKMLPKYKKNHVWWQNSLVYCDQFENHYSPNIWDPHDWNISKESKQNAKGQILSTGREMKLSISYLKINSERKQKKQTFCTNSEVERNHQK